MNRRSFVSFVGAAGLAAASRFEIRADSRSTTIEQTRDIYAFLFENLGVEYK